MNKRLYLYLPWVLFLLLSAAPSLFGAGRFEADSSKIDGVIVFNAASTTDIISEAGRLFREETGIPVYTNPASSGTLARQIEQGAMADIYISASRRWMTYAVEKKLCIEHAAFLENRLVLIEPVSAEDPLTIEIDSSANLPSLFEGRISIGDPAHVPAGGYAAEALEYFGWMEALSTRILPSADVRGALLVVELGETAFGIVYATDAAKSEKVRVAGKFPVESHSPIMYYCGLTPGADSDAQRLYRFILESALAAQLYEGYGFTAVD